MKNYIFIAICIITLSNCKKKEDPKPKPTPTPEVVKPKVAYHKDIKLYNQFVTDATIKHFYRLKDSTYTNDPKADFDFCYLNMLLSGKNSFILGSPADAVYTQNTSAYPLTNGGSNNFTSYYQLPIDFSYANFDTLSVSTGLKDFIESKATIKYSDNNFKLAQALLCDDNFGWSAKSVFGFKTSKGKYGIIKFITSPTGDISDPAKKTGVVIIDIKVEQ